MERADFVNNFAKRLNSLLQKRSYPSNCSRANVTINQLAKIANVSYQMARKYTLGLALPDYDVIFQIATHLKVSPGWLLFGDKAQSVIPTQKSLSSIEIDSTLLKYILHKCVVLFPYTHESEKIINFIVGVIYDASHIDTDNKTILKIIDMMVSSAMQFSNLDKQRA